MASIVAKRVGNSAEHLAPLRRTIVVAMATVVLVAIVRVFVTSRILVHVTDAADPVQAVAALRTFTTIQTIVAAVTLTALLIEAKLLLFPAIRSIRSEIKQLEIKELAQKERSRQFEADNSKLRVEQQALQGVATNLEAANQRIEVAAKRFEELFQGLPVACLGYDASGAILEWNRASEELFGDATKLFGTHLVDLLKPATDEDELRAILPRVLEGESYSALSISSESESGLKFYLCSTFPVHGTSGVHGAIFACVDVTAQKTYEKQIEEHLARINEYSVAIEQQKWELQEANDRLQSLARQDGLTGLYNHRSFQEALARDIRRVEREGGQLSLVLLDVDNFKNYNDSFGHPAGDALLKQFGQLLLSTSREADLVARYGGEEFVVILSSTDVAGARLAAERMRSAIERADWPHRQVTASFGIATMDDKLGSPAALIAASDRALYASKAAGRNACTHCVDLRLAA